MMSVTSRYWVTIIWWLTAIDVTLLKPLPIPCIETDSVDIMALAVTETSKFPQGVEVVKENGINGYRFDIEARVVGASSSEFMTQCQYFPQEFSLVITFRKEIPTNENEYLLTLLGQDRLTILIGVRLQRDKLHFDFVGKAAGQRRSASYQDARFADGAWHTVVITVTKSQVKFTLDCSQSSISELSKPFPRKLDIRRTRFHIASRLRKRNRFTGMLRQVKLVPGADASYNLCSSTSTRLPSWMESHLTGTSALSQGNPFVKFDNSDDVTMTCSDENNGQLMYRKNYGRLEMCEGRKWKRLATTQERLDYVDDFGQLMTKSKTMDIEVFRIPGEGLFLASANQGRDRNMDSTIYKWSSVDKRFEAFQSIRTDVARNWKHFKIEREHFLAVANQGSEENSPVAQSAIYRWDKTRKKFLLLQFIRTFSARSWESFVIGGKHYLVVANYASEENHKQKSWVYIWNHDHRAFINYQPLDTIGAYDFEYFQDGNNHYLAVANSYDGLQTKLDSIIYQWRQSNFVPLQYVETFGATDWEHFVISGRHYLAVANYYNYAKDDNRYFVDSNIFEFHPDINQFKKLQDIRTQGALDLEFFTVGRDSFLIAASSSDGNEKINSVIYRWQGMEHFVPVHTIATDPCADWETFRTDEGEIYLVSANVQSRTSKLLQMVTF